MARVRPDKPMTEEECFAALGVAEDATPEDLKRAYRRQLRLNHPDLNGGNHERSEQLRRAQQAYRTLEERRRGISLHEPPRGRKTNQRPVGSRGQSSRLSWKATFARGNLYDAWKRWALLPILMVAVVSALAWRGGDSNPDYMAYHSLFIGAIGAALGVYGIGLFVLSRGQKK